MPEIVYRHLRPCSAVYPEFGISGFDERRYAGWTPVRGQQPVRACICQLPVHIQAQLWPGPGVGNDYSDRAHPRRNPYPWEMEDW